MNHHSQNDGSTSEAMVFADLLTWSNDCPTWQRDALRRLCTQEKLELLDQAELLAICKGSAEAQPLTAAHIRDSSSSGADVSLSALYALEHVNALATGERLTFSKTGLTVIYGDNGAGKSSYARVLKQACRARSPKGDTILSNIYAASTGVPTASIDFHVGGQKRKSQWMQGSGAEAALSAVSIFDSRTANVHVENTNDLAYTPLPLTVLAALAQTCQDLKSKLAAEVAALEKADTCSHHQSRLHAHDPGRQTNGQPYCQVDDRSDRYTRRFRSRAGGPAANASDGFRQRSRPCGAAPSRDASVDH